MTHPYNGILLVDKPSGISSFNVIYKLRKILNMKKIGHAGTLDPLATGLLIILLGKATKASQYLILHDKVYEGEIKLGEATDSYDAEGKITATKDFEHVSKEDVHVAIKHQTGEFEQLPPMFSAIKVDGQRLYKAARKGIEIKRDTRSVNVYQFDLLQFNTPLLNIRIHCSKGTYIRSIAHDLGEELNCGAHLSSLRRVQSGEFKIEDSLTLEKIEAMTADDVSSSLQDHQVFIPVKNQIKNI
ncbi:MAG: tRNA pseudouridine(55) synthase TruB [Planctomycetota bacterium]|nr:MAG: tRNA pseudouridine(55) synthase TruB [Planctomycetota bacterium]